MSKIYGIGDEEELSEDLQNEIPKRIIEELKDVKKEIENINPVYEKTGRTTIMKNFDDIKSEVFEIIDKHIKENKQ